MGNTSAAAKGNTTAKRRTEETAPLLDDDGPTKTESFDDRVGAVCGQPCLYFLRALSGLTMAAGLLVAAVNVDAAVRADAHGVRTYALRAYAALFGLLVAIGELERPRCLLTYVQFLHSWPAKGLFVVFVGLLTLENEDSASSKTSTVAQTATAYVTMLLGAGYVIVGVLCLPLRTSYGAEAYAYASIPDDEEDDDPKNDVGSAAAVPPAAPPPPARRSAGLVSGAGFNVFFGGGGGPPQSSSSSGGGVAEFLEDDAPSWMDPARDHNGARLVHA